MILGVMKLDERACSYVPKFCCFYEVFLEIALCFPISYSIKNAQCKFRTILVQIMPKWWCILIGLIVMFVHTLRCDGLEFLV